MSVKIYINESDDEKARVDKIGEAVVAYGKELYDRCHHTSACSKGVREYITPTICEEVAYSGLIHKLLVLPSGHEFEMPINPSHIMRVISLAEEKMNQEKSFNYFDEK